MTQTDNRDEIAGPVRFARNEHINTGMHSDKVATKFGLRGGAVHGGTHLDLFPPLLVDLFGERWLQRGSLSVFFRNAILDGEGTRAFVTRPPAGDDVLVPVRAEREDGMLIGEGTAGIGNPATPSALQALEMKESPNRRILAGLHVGDTSPDYPVRFAPERQSEWLRFISLSAPWYESAERWGGLVIPPAELLRFTYHPAMDGWVRTIIPGVAGLWGALELKYVDGPVLVDRPYVVRTRIAGLDEGTKTELLWLDNELDDESGRRIAETRILVRWFKAGSPLWV